MIRSYIPCMGQYPLTPLESKHESPFWMLMIVTREPSKTAKVFRCFKSRNQVDLKSKFRFEKNKNLCFGPPRSLWKNTPVILVERSYIQGAYISTSSNWADRIDKLMDDNLQLFHPHRKNNQGSKRNLLFFNFQSSWCFWCLLDQETAVSQTVKHSRKVPMASWGCRTNEHSWICESLFIGKGAKNKFAWKNLRALRRA